MLSLLFHLFSALQFSAAQYPEPLSYEYRLVVQPSYFSSTENLNNDGQKVALVNGGKFTNLTTRTSLFYNWREQLQVLAGGDFAYSQSTRGNEDRSNLNFSEAFLGANYFFNLKKISLIPQALLALSTSEVDPNGDEVLMSEHAHSLNLGFWSIYESKIVSPYVYLGSNLMSDNRAWLYILKVGAKYQAADFSIYGEICNSAPFKDDQYVLTPQYRWLVSDRVDGGSYRYYSVNPELLEFLLGTNINFEGLSGGIAMGIPISGRRVANGLSIIFNVSFDFGSTLEIREILQDKKTVKPKAASKKKQFREQTEDEDQELFEESK